MENKENCDDQITKSNGLSDDPKLLPVDKNASQEQQEERKDTQQDEVMEEVSLLDQTENSESALPISLSSSISTDKINTADLSEILNTSNESEITEPGGSKGPALSAEETKEVLKEKLSKFQEWCIVNGLALSNKVCFMLHKILNEIISH